MKRFLSRELLCGDERRWSTTNKMSIKKACAVLGFKSPPTDKKTLKTSFGRLAKMNHPDVLNAVNGKSEGAERERLEARSQDRMSEITEAYKLLQGLLDKRVGGDAGASKKGPEEVPSWWEGDSDATRFQAPSFSVSSGDMWLPWQRSGPSRTFQIGKDSDVTNRLVSSTSDFLSFRAEYRQYENKMQEAEAARMTPEPKAGAGHSGDQYSKEHFQKERIKRTVFGGEEQAVCFRRRSTFDLFFVYIKERSLSKLFRSMQYIFSGK